jgi:group I intron endonuclease
MIGIYFIKNKINNKMYIGLSTNIENRFLFHKRRLLSNTHKNSHFQSSFNENGIENFEFGILEECIEVILSEREKYWISFYRSHNREFGYNKTFGGEFGKMSDEINERRRQKLKLQTIPQEMRDRISKTLTGRKQPKEVVDNRAKSCRKCNDEIEQKIIDLYINKKLNTKQISELLNIKRTTVISIVKRNKNASSPNGNV